MAKGRMLLKRISKSDKLNALSCDTARLLYTWMLAYLDCNGCYHANPVIVKNEVFCVREDVTKQKVESYLDEMENLLLIKRYNNNQYLFYPDFEEKQPKIQKDREGKSEIPEPEIDLRKSTQELLKSYSRVTPTQYNIKEVKVTQVKSRVTPEQQNLCKLLRECILRNNPKALIDDKDWASDCRLMMEKDHREYSDIEAVIRWCQNDNFWKSNVLSMSKVREKFDTLYMRMKSNGKSTLPTTSGTLKQDIRDMLDKSRIAIEKLRASEAGAEAVLPKPDINGTAKGDKRSKEDNEKVSETSF